MSSQNVRKKSRTIAEKGFSYLHEFEGTMEA